MKVGDLRRFKEISEFPSGIPFDKGIENKVFFIKKITEGLVVIYLFDSGKEWWFDYHELRYYSEIFLPDKKCP